jgi:hypothetical protein
MDLIEPVAQHVYLPSNNAWWTHGEHDGTRDTSLGISQKTTQHSTYLKKTKSSTYLHPPLKWISHSRCRQAAATRKGYTPSALIAARPTRHSGVKGLMDQVCCVKHIDAFRASEQVFCSTSFATAIAATISLSTVQDAIPAEWRMVDQRPNDHARFPYPAVIRAILLRSSPTMASDISFDDAADSIVSNCRPREQSQDFANYEVLSDQYDTLD